MIPQDDLLRHLLATIGYRGSRALHGAPDTFGAFEAGHGAMSAGQLLNHVNIVLAMAHARWLDYEFVKPAPATWAVEVERFFDLLLKLDGVARSGKAPVATSLPALLQGPLTDVLTHIGQLALLRRLAGVPVEKGPSYFTAPVTPGRVRYA